MTRSELINLLSKQFPILTQADIKQSVDVIIETIGDGLAKGDRTEIRGFGSFSRRYRLPRKGRNPKTGETVMVPGKASLHFKQSRDILNDDEVIEAEVPERMAA